MGEAKELVCYAAPGIRKEPAAALVRLAQRPGPKKLTVWIDFDERVLRMGYGDLEAVRMLRQAGITVNHFPQLRSALCIVDNEGYSFTPTPLYLEAELGIESCNSIRLSPEQVSEALGRFSRVAEPEKISLPGTVAEKEILLVSESEEKKVRSSLEEGPSAVAVSLEKVDDRHFQEIDESLKLAPPVAFDVARQVRVFQPYFQYVELRLTGAAIQRRRVVIPEVLLQLGAGKEFEGRLRTTFELIEKTSPLSSKGLENKLNEIRNNFTFSLKKDKGRVMFQNKKEELKESLKEFREKLEVYKKDVGENLKEKLAKALEEIEGYYLPLVMKNPPKCLTGKLPSKLTEKEAKEWLKKILSPLVPSAENFAKSVTLDESYKDVTYETLKDEDFLNQIKAQCPSINWEKAYKEFTAAGEKVVSEETV